MRVAFRDLPLISIHPYSIISAQAARCAGEVGGSDGYWAMYHALFDGQAEWAAAANEDAAMDFFKGYAAGLDLDTDAYDMCLDEGETAEAVSESAQEGAALGLNGTPAFTIGEGQLFGALPFEQFQDAFEIVLAGGSLPTPTPQPTQDIVEVEAPMLDVEVGDAPVNGDPDAPITIIEFTDYQCPYCGAYAKETYPVVVEDYIDTGRVRYVFLDFPLKNIHPDAVTAAQAAHCARDQGGDEAYFKMHDIIFAEQVEWAVGVDNVPDLLSGYADEIGLDGDALLACLEADTHGQTVEDGFNLAVSSGLGGTPTFIINGYMLAGAYPPDMFSEILDKVEAGEAPTVQMPREMADEMAAATEQAAGGDGDDQSTEDGGSSDVDEAGDTAGDDSGTADEDQSGEQTQPGSQEQGEP